MSRKESSKGFEFNPLGIASIFKQNALAIPLHQREYSWDTHQVKELFSDLQEAISNSSDYFLGTIVAIPDSDERTLNIVDGQQRLTTTAIFLAAMRDYLLENDLDKFTEESIENEFLSKIDRRNQARIPRLRLNVDDNDFFVKLIEKRGTIDCPEPSRESHKKLVEAARISRNFVNSISESAGKKSANKALNDWLEFLEEDATVILLKAPDSSQAFKMFETLNDRGLKTSQVDLVKSYIFGRAGSRINECQSNWSSMKNTLEEIDDEDKGINFLRHLLMCTIGFTRANDVYTTVTDKFKNSNTAVSFSSQLESFSRFYVATFRSDSEMWSGYSKSSMENLKILNMFNIKPMRPLIMSIAKHFEKNEFEKATRLLVSVSVRLLIASSTRGGTVEESFANSALKIYQKGILNTKDLKTELKKIVPDDTSFIKAFSEISLSRTDYARYYLRTFEEAHANEKERERIINDDQSEITLEHIFPKSFLASEWPLFSKENSQLYVRRLGNMCLLKRKDNSDAKSNSFVSKKKAYEKSDLYFTKSLAQFKDWTIQNIENRQLEIAKLAPKAWPY